MNDFERTDIVIQNYIDIISSEGKKELLLNICNIYHHKFDTPQQALDWGLNFGQYVGKFNFTGLVWKFTLIDGTTLYFLGSRKIVLTKIFNLL